MLSVEVNDPARLMSSNGKHVSFAVDINGAEESRTIPVYLEVGE